MSDFQSPPDPAGSPIEKLVVQHRFPARREFARYLLAQGVDPDTAEKFGRAVDEWEKDKDFDKQSLIQELELWSNIHTHAAGDGGIPSFETNYIHALDSTAEHSRFTLATDSWDSSPIAQPFSADNAGIGRTGEGTFLLFSTNASEYDTEASAWTSKTAPPVAVSSHGSAGDPVNGKVYSVGGGGGARTNDFQIYDVETDSWSAGPAYPITIFRNACTVVNDILYSVGGFAGSGATGAAFFYDPDVGSWGSIASYPETAGTRFPLAGVGNKLYSVDPDGPTTYIYDIDTDAWSTGAAPPSQFGQGYGASDGSKFYPCGGGVIAYYDPGTDTWSATFGAAAANAGCVAVPLM